MAVPSAEKNFGQLKGPETAPAVVSQPMKIESHLSNQLGSILEEVNKISEVASSGAGEQWSGASGAVATTGGQQTAQPVASARDQAIAAIPVQAVMQKDLEKHIRMEVKKLRKQAKQIAGLGRAGNAYKLNQLYARIRHMNALLAEILQSSYDVVKRLFIRVFIDRQPIL